MDSIERATSHLIHVDQVEENWSTLHDSQAIIFGSPTYIGSVSDKIQIICGKISGRSLVKTYVEK